MDGEIAKMMDGVRLLYRANDKALVVFAVRKTRQSKYARDVRRRRIAVELYGERTKKDFGLGWIEPFDTPHNLVLFRRSIENEIGNGRVAAGSNRPKRCRCILVEVEIDMANFENAGLGSGKAAGRQWIHPDENVRARPILLMKPILKRRTRDILREKNSLRRLLFAAIAN